MNKISFDELAGQCDFQKPSDYFIVENGKRKEGPLNCISGKLCSAQNCPLRIWFEMLFGYTSKSSNITKIRNNNKTHTLSNFGQGFVLQNESEKSMTMTEKSLFDILDEFFRLNF